MFLQDLFRQTGGFRKVASAGAILQRYVYPFVHLVGHFGSHLRFSSFAYGNLSMDIDFSLYNGNRVSNRLGSDLRPNFRTLDRNVIVVS